MLWMTRRSEPSILTVVETSTNNLPEHTRDTTPAHAT